MIDVNDKTDPDLSALDGKRQTSGRYPDHREAIRLSEEELKVYKKCSNESFIKAGLPFAVFFDVVRTLVKKRQGEIGPLDASAPITKSLNVKRGMVFFGNIVFGSIFYTPVCYRRLKEFHEANERKRMAEQAEGSAPFAGFNVKAQPEDFSYPTDLVTNLGDSDSSFLDDFNASKLILEEDEKPKAPQTTYDDLRHRNRERQTQGINKAPHSIDSSRLSTPSEQTIPVEPPPRRVKKNKYGDEME